MESGFAAVPPPFFLIDVHAVQREVCRVLEIEQQRNARGRRETLMRAEQVVLPWRQEFRVQEVSNQLSANRQENVSGQCQ